MCVLAPASRFDDVMTSTNRMGMVMSANTETFVSLAVLKAKAGRRDDLRAALLALIEPTRAEVGCLDYVLFEQRDEPGSFTCARRSAIVRRSIRISPLLISRLLLRGWRRFWPSRCA